MHVPLRQVCRWGYTDCVCGGSSAEEQRAYLLGGDINFVFLTPGPSLLPSLYLSLVLIVHHPVPIACPAPPFRAQAFHYLIVARDVGLLQPWIGSGSEGEAFERAWQRCRAAWLLSGNSSSRHSDAVEGAVPELGTAVETVRGEDCRNIMEHGGHEEEEEGDEEDSDASDAGQVSSLEEEPSGRGSGRVGGALSGAESKIKAIPGASGPSSLQRDVLKVLLQLAAQSGSAMAVLSDVQQSTARAAGSTMALLPVSPADGLAGRRAAAMQLLAGASICHEYKTLDGLFSIDIAVIVPSELHKDVSELHWDPSEQGSPMRGDEASSMRTPATSPQQSGGSGSVSGERPQLRLAIEVDGPTHYMTSSSSRHSDGAGTAAEGGDSHLSLTGATALRNKCLVRRGWAVSGLPWWQWDSMWGNDEAKQHYLVELLLASHGVSSA